MRIGLLGGTFDPVHNGHAALVQSALACGRIDRLIIMPAGTPPHKEGRSVSMAGYRYEMAVQAFAGQSAVEVSTMEILRSGPSYTLETIRQLKDVLPSDSELLLIYGSDILFDIEKWYEPAAIMSACPLLLADRGGLNAVYSREKADELISRFGARIEFFKAPAIDISSTKIREAVETGLAYQQWVPEKVARVIRKHGLYRYQAELADVSADLMADLSGLERQVWPLLDRKRLLHSLNVMVYALHLARVHQVNMTQAGKAAILHDCAKCLPKNETCEYARLAGDETLLDPELAHGPAGAWLAQTRFGISDPLILRAIHYHTTGSAGMTSLDKIIFIADKVEPARTYENLDTIRRLVEYDLDAALQICLSEIDLFLSRERLTPHPYTRHARDELDRRLNGRNGPQA